MIELLKYIFLGFIQGMTETIPVSSSGHLMIFKRIMDVNVDFDTIAILTNFGSLIAIIILFWDDIVKIIKGFFKYLTKKDKADSNETSKWIDYYHKLNLPVVAINSKDQKDIKLVLKE